MTKNPGGIFFTVYGISHVFLCKNSSFPFCYVKFSNFIGYVFLKKLGLGEGIKQFGVFFSDSTQKTVYIDIYIYIVLFPGLNSPIQVKIPQYVFVH